MTDLREKPGAPLLTFLFAFVPAVASFIVGFIAAEDSAHTRNWRSTQALVAHIDEYIPPAANSEDHPLYTVYLQFEVDGQPVEAITDRKGPTWDEGKTVVVLYNPENPTQVFNRMDNILPFILFPFGGFLLCISVAVLIDLRKRRRR